MNVGSKFWFCLFIWLLLFFLCVVVVVFVTFLLLGT